MDQLLIHTALSLPAVSASPSANCLRWTGDGQLLVLTKSAVYILTPELGVQVERSGVIKQALDTENSPNGVMPIGWLRTMIEFDKTLARQWPADCQDWGAVSLGSLDPVLRSVTPSPGNTSTDGGCVVAVLNSNMELTIWGPIKNHLRGQWSKLQDVPVDLFNTVPIKEAPVALQRTLQAQITCIEWSSQADFGLSPAPTVDGSLLAVGSRAGSITCLRYSDNSEISHDIRSMAAFPVGDRWVTHLAWSHWKVLECGICEGFLACGSSDGSINVVRTVQKLQPVIPVSPFTLEYELKQSYEVQDINPSEPDGRGITAMRWVDVPGRRPVLLYSKPGVLHLWSGPSLAMGWSGSRALPLRTQKLSVGSSALCCVTGAEYIRASDVLVVSLSDGSFHVVHAISAEPSLTPPPSVRAPTSETVSANGRSVFLKVESEDLQFKDVNSINGMVSYDHHATFMWIHEASRPMDFSYKHDAKHVSMFVVAQLWSTDDDDSWILRELKERIANAKACSGQPPTSLLRPVLLHLRDPHRLSRLCRGVVEILQQSSGIASIRVAVLPYDGELTTEVRRHLKRSLVTSLFGWDALLSERMKLVISEFCRNHSDGLECQTAFAQAAAHSSSAIWHLVLRTIIRHIGAVITVMSPNDMPIVRRFIVQASLPAIPAGLTREAEDLAARAASVDGALDIGSVDELCPACQAPVPLRDIAQAECPNGHVWPRCSVTSFILSIPMVRTCIGCGRKAFLPITQTIAHQIWLPQAARHGWFVQDLLDATRRCFLCGNNYVALL